MAGDNTFTQGIKFSVDDKELMFALEKLQQALKGLSGNVPVKSMSSDLKKAGNEAKKTAEETAKIGKESKKAAVETSKLAGTFDKLKGAIAGAVGAYVGFQGLAKLVDFGRGSIDAFVQQRKSEQMLDTVLKNQGMDAASSLYKGYASQLQKSTTIGDESMIAGAAELSTYVKDPKQMTRMMKLLSDYAMGMTGGAEMNPQSLTQLATGLGMAFDGNYRSLRMKGFDTSELETIQKALGLKSDIENGNIKTDKNTGALQLNNEQKELLKWLESNKGKDIEALKVDALERSMDVWKGLAEEFAKTDEGKIQQLKNDVGDLREEVGRQLLPVVGRLAATLKANLPKIKETFGYLEKLLETLLDDLNKALPQIFYFSQEFMKVLDIFAKAPVLFTGVAVAAKMLAPAMVAAVGETTVLGKALKGLGGKLAVTAGAVWGFFQILKAGKLILDLGEESERAREIKKSGDDMNSWLNVKNTYAPKLSAMNSIMSDLDNGSVSDSALIDKIKAFGSKYGESFESNGILAKLMGYDRSLDLEDFDRADAKALFERMIKEDTEDLKNADEKYNDAKKRFEEAVGMESVDMSEYWKDPDYGSEDDYDAEMKKATEAYQKELLGSVNLAASKDAKGDTNITKINYTNNITTDSDLMSKMIRENLRTLLTSQLTIVNRTEAVKAMGL